ncbi:hypothetical protein [Burkholderia gladioli]|uniref:hypothetical protein n=1 Tax=Burkholderia gladioli TaxID=28095 RepID=UPI000FD8F55A|nr:hypothetical protein [Burkholderia gladioli]
MLGYLKESAQNRALRMATLSSHVQIHRNFSPAPTESKTLKRTLSSLNGAREILWDAALPEMVGAYFSDMTKILQDCYTTLRKKGALWMVVVTVDMQISILMYQKSSANWPLRWISSRQHRTISVNASSPQQEAEKNLPNRL